MPPAAFFGAFWSAADSPNPSCRLSDDWPSAWIDGPDAAPARARAVLALGPLLRGVVVVVGGRRRGRVVGLVDLAAAARALHAGVAGGVRRVDLEGPRERHPELPVRRLLAEGLDVDARAGLVLLAVLRGGVLVRRVGLRGRRVRLVDGAVAARAPDADRVVGVAARAAAALRLLPEVLDRLGAGHRGLPVLGLLTQRPGCPGRLRTRIHRTGRRSSGRRSASCRSCSTRRPSRSPSSTGRRSRHPRHDTPDTGVRSATVDQRASHTSWDGAATSASARPRRVLTNLEAWIRRRMRVYLWRQWRTRQNRCAELRRRGVAKFPAAVAAGSPTGLWRMSGHPAVHKPYATTHSETLGLPRIDAPAQA